MRALLETARFAGGGLLLVPDLLVKGGKVAVEGLPGTDVRQLEELALASLEVLVASHLLATLVAEEGATVRACHLVAAQQDCFRGQTDDAISGKTSRG